MQTHDPIQTDAFNMAEYVLRTIPREANKTALEIVGPNTRNVWSYGQIDNAVFGIAQGLRKLGYAPGDRVLLRMANRVEFPLAYLGAIAAGLVPVPTSAQLTESEISKIAHMIQPALILADEDTVLPKAGTNTVIFLDQLRAMFHEDALLPVQGNAERLAYIIFTSGTAATPKGVCHAHRAITARRMMWDDWYGLSADDKLMHAGAFNWTYTLGTGLMDPWTIGATAVIPSPDVTPAQLPELIAELDVTIFAAAPGIYRQCLRGCQKFPKTRLRHGLSAGEKLPEAVAKDWQDKTGTQVHEALGMSEISTFISGSPNRPAPQGSSGYAQKGRNIVVLDPNGNPVKPDEPGELAISRADPGLMLGYLDQPALEAAWFRTGDMVSQSEDGAIRYLGRTDDMMNAGGFRVSPMEVEKAFADVPGMIDAAAVSIEVKPGTFVIALFFAASSQIEEDDLRAHAHKTLAHYKQPRLYIHRASLPKGPNGKMNRRKLRAEFEAKHG